MERKEPVTDGLQHQGCVWLHRNQLCVGVRQDRARADLLPLLCLPNAASHLSPAGPTFLTPQKTLFLSPCSFALSHSTAHPFCTHTSHLPFFSHSNQLQKSPQLSSPFQQMLPSWCLNHLALEHAPLPTSTHALYPYPRLCSAWLRMPLPSPAGPGAGCCGGTTQQQAPEHIGC